MQPINATPEALTKIKAMIDDRNEPNTLGIRIGVNTRGCSGLAYTMEYVDEETSFDEKAVFDDVSIYIDPKAIMFVLGLEIGYEENDLEEGFVFKNPNEKDRCGCGESFTV